MTLMAKLQIIDNAGRLVKIILQEKNQVFGLKDILNLVEGGEYCKNYFQKNQLHKN
jgi:hypothetical protein